MYYKAKWPNDKICLLRWWFGKNKYLRIDATAVKIRRDRPENNDFTQSEAATKNKQSDVMM